MYAPPDSEELVAIARQLGIRLTREEAELSRQYVISQLNEIDSFVQDKVSESRPPMASPSRQPGYRPSSEEDPLNAWTWKCRIEGAAKGILSGKTVSYKDTIPVAGMPMSYGSFRLDGFIPDFDATVVSRVLAEGGVITGKNALSGFSSFGVAGDGGDYGPSLNPHNHGHRPGGSSSGSAVAVAAREVDISFGGDSGGSIRIPAAFTGVIGHKPTFGLVSQFGIAAGFEQSLDNTGPIAYTVQDAAAALEATAGYDQYNPWQAPGVPRKVDVLRTLHNGVSGIRLGVLEEGFDGGDPEVCGLVRGAIDVLSKAGARVSKVSIPYHNTIGAAFSAIDGEGSLALFKIGFFGAFAKTYYPSSLIVTQNKMCASEPDALSFRTKLALIIGQLSRNNYYGRVYAKAQNVRPSYVKAYDTALAEVDVLVMPTVLTTAPRNPPQQSYLEALKSNLLALSCDNYSRNTRPFNYTGHPALAVPVGKSAGLPVSMQLVGRFFDDPLLMRVAYAYQESVSWQEIVGVDGSVGQ